MIYIIEGEEFEWADKLLVTKVFDEKKFEKVIRKQLEHYICGVTLSCYKDEEIIFARTFQKGNKIEFDDCVYPYNRETGMVEIQTVIKF